MSQIMIGPKECREMGYCMQQVRPWLVANGFDITTFVRVGVPAEDLAATGDELALRIVEHAQAKAHGQG